MGAKRPPKVCNNCLRRNPSRSYRLQITEVIPGIQLTFKPFIVCEDCFERCCDGLGVILGPKVEEAS